MTEVFGSIPEKPAEPDPATAEWVAGMNNERLVTEFVHASDPYAEWRSKHGHIVVDDMYGKNPGERELGEVEITIRSILTPAPENLANPTTVALMQGFLRAANRIWFADEQETSGSDLPDS